MGHDMDDSTARRVRLADLVALKAEGRKFAMLTAYDHPTAVALHAARIPVVLIGDSMGSVVLGQESTRGVPLELMLTLGEAVRRGAPDAFLVGDIPWSCVERGEDAVLDAAERFRDICGCDSVKIEVSETTAPWVETLSTAGFVVVAHHGLCPQTVTERHQLRAQARDEESVARLVVDASASVERGAQLLLLEAVPNEAAGAVVAAVTVPVIGCGAGRACDGHVVVTHDMLGFGDRVPRFVPVLANASDDFVRAMTRFGEMIESGAYPGPEHTYGMRAASAPTA